MQAYRNINLSEEQVHEYYSLLMQSDPYPGDPSGNEIAVTTADAMATAFGFPDWVTHYHSFGKEPHPKLGEEKDGF